MSSYNQDTVSSQQLGHLGLIAATIAELGIIDKIDSRIELYESKGGIVGSITILDKLVIICYVVGNTIL